IASVQCAGPPHSSSPRRRTYRLAAVRSAPTIPLGSLIPASSQTAGLGRHPHSTAVSGSSPRIGAVRPASLAGPAAGADTARVKPIEFELERTIRAPIDQVFARLVDIDGYNEWMAGTGSMLRHTRQTSPGEPAGGTTFIDDTTQ